MDPFIGQIMMFAGNFPPRGWAKCDGSLLSIQQNSALFSILGTMYGGDGKSTFGLPDMRGRMPIHVGTGPGLSPLKQGVKGGSESVTLTDKQIPAHNHEVNCANGGGDSAKPAGNFPGVDGRSTQYNDSSNATMARGMIGNAGNGEAHSNMPPYLPVVFCIALTGIFPSRN
jgi:microcystin-dependent protein